MVIYYVTVQKLSYISRKFFPYKGEHGIIIFTLYQHIIYVNLINFTDVQYMISPRFTGGLMNKWRGVTVPT